MAIEALPTEEQLAQELARFIKNGLGRDLPGAQSERDVQALSDISSELADDSSEEWTTRIARVVIEEVRGIKPEVPDQLAVADILAIGDPERRTEEIIADIEAGETVDDLDARYQQAANRYPKITARTFAEDRRRSLLERVGKRLLKKLKARRGAVEEKDNPPPPTLEVDPMKERTDDDEGRHRAEAPPLLVGTIGGLLVAIGVAWLIATVAGTIG